MGTGNNIDLGTLGGDLSGASAINEAGRIAGWARNSQGLSRATLFDPTGAGNNLGLGTLGGVSSEAFCINDAGQIVGQAENSQGEWRATLFDPTGAGNNINLNTLIDPAGGWTLVNAYDINASGWIVGKGTNPQGEKHAFLLVPEPATFALLGMGILCLRKRFFRGKE
jgi:probable HAF family extracellular repeat protein